MDPDDYDDCPEDDEPDQDCGMMPDGYYSLAGIEWCDWECQNSR